MPEDGGKSERGAERRGGDARVTSVVLSKDLFEQLDQFSWAYRLTRSKVVEDALRDYFKRNPPPEVLIKPRK